MEAIREPIPFTYWTGVWSSSMKRKMSRVSSFRLGLSPTLAETASIEHGRNWLVAETRKLKPETLLYVWTLRCSPVRSLWLVHYLDIELHGNVFRGEACIVAAGLISQLTVNGEIPGPGSLGRAHLRFYREIVRVDIQFFARIKRKTHVLPRRIGDAPSGEIGRGFELQCGRNEKFRFGLIRINVEALFD